MTGVGSPPADGARGRGRVDGQPTAPQPVINWVPHLDDAFSGDPLATRPDASAAVRRAAAAAQPTGRSPQPTGRSARHAGRSARPTGRYARAVGPAPAATPPLAPGAGQGTRVAPRPHLDSPRVQARPRPQAQRPGPRHERSRGKDGKRDLPKVDPAELRVTVLIPAHNEAGGITATIASLRWQERLPDHIVVIADNCDDPTADLAALCGVEVVVTRGNKHKKAGALNQVLDRMLPYCGPLDVVMVMDADSSLDPGFIRTGVAYLASGVYAAIGGTFTGKPGGGLVGMFQRNEYARYARDVRRLGGHALVLTGTATLFRASVLQEVVDARRLHTLPGRPAVYDVRVLTEDNELTLAILHLDFRILCPPGCTLTTEVMTTWGDLFRQRLRWKRGALENLIDYGWTEITRPYWGRQALSLLGIIVIFTYLVTLAIALVVGGLRLNPVWIGVTAVFMVERIVSVRRRGPVQMAIAATIWIEMIFDVFLQVAQAKAFWEALLNKERKW